MPLREVPLEKFGGLDLLTDPGEIGADAAIDLLNVDFDQLGKVRTRNGFVKYTTAEGTNHYDSLHPYNVTGERSVVVAGSDRRLESIINGAVSKVETTNGTPHYFTSYGTANETRVYIGNGADTVRYYTNDQFTTPTYTGTTPKGKFLATQQPDNRLVAARPNSHTSRVLFSDPGDPHTFGADNYVDLSPGDGEQISALVSWREFVFAFKETKFYIFYGNSVDASGGPVFNVRGVYGAGVRIGQSAVAGTDGVYFMDRRGIYKTTGGNPTLVSRPVEPLFAPISNPSSNQLQGTEGSNPVLHWADDRLYLSYSTTGMVNDRTLVYHCTDNWWTLWDVGADSFCTARISATDPLREALIFGYASGLKHIGQFTNSNTDDGAGISSYYQTGFMDFGDSTRKVVKEWMFDGNGVITAGCATDYAPALTASTSVTLGSQVRRNRARRSYQGHNFSLKIASTAGSTWRLNRAIAHVRSKNPPGIDARSA